MISATVGKSNKGDYLYFRCKGHAEYSEHGRDIVCAAVSILVINTANAIEALTENKIKGSDKGEIILEFPLGLDDKGKLLMDTLVMGLSQIREQYVDFLELNFKEV
ncbi:MAG: ribosomal-processing cysteine protease Prp [Lachnospiraceae bacterium]|nr:ribosomal-processing cysteine protease Prp [Lachnospiraceae bacterium]